MAGSLKPIKDAHSRTVGIEFRPSLKMLKVALAFSRAENLNQSNAEVLKALKITEDEFGSWFRDYVITETNPDGTIKSSKNYFEEWWDEQLQIKSGEEKEMLRAVGMRKALDGHFQFWKELSRTYGTISPEFVEHHHHVVPFNLGHENATPENLKAARTKLMAAQRTLADRDGLDLASAPPEGSKGKAD